jgi:hypothetical protein
MGRWLAQRGGRTIARFLHGKKEYMSGVALLAST